jgi:hypothetical protein
MVAEHHENGGGVKISELLLAAKDRVQFGDWIQENWHLRDGEPLSDDTFAETTPIHEVPAAFDEHDAFCVEGAIASAIYMAMGSPVRKNDGSFAVDVEQGRLEWANSPQCVMQLKVEKAFMAGLGLPELVRRLYPGVSAWNDDPDRTKEQVIDGLDRAARWAKEQEDAGAL